MNKSVKQIDNLKKSIKSTSIEAQKLEAKGRINFTSDKQNISGSIKLRIDNETQKIWISATKFGFEGVRALIDRDSFYMLNRLEKTYIKGSLAEMSNRFQVPAKYEYIEDLLIGDVVWFGNPELNVTNDTITVVSLYNNSKAIYSIDPVTTRPRNLNISDQEGQMISLLFDNYELFDQGMFSKKRVIDLDSRQMKSKATLDFSKIEWEKTFTQPFEIPKSYKQIPL